MQDFSLYVIITLILYYKTFLANPGLGPLRRIILILYYKTFLANVKFSLYLIIILILYYKTFLANVRVRSLRHNRLSGYAVHLPQLHTKTQAHVVHLLLFKQFFVKAKLTMAG